MTDDELLAEHETLMADYEATKEPYDALVAAGFDAEHPDHVSARASFDAAQVALAEHRKYWRQIGEAVDLGHPGSRDLQRPVKVTNNDGSVSA